MAATADGSYSVAPRPVGRRERPMLAALVVALAGGLLVALAALGGVPEGAAPARLAVEPSVARPSTDPSGVAVARGPWTLAPGEALAVPERIACTTVPSLACAAAVRAAGEVVWAPGEKPVRATVHASLVCGSHRDCPRRLIADARPVGSVVFRFDDGREVWVNVVRPSTTAAGRPRELRAHVVRWWSGA